MSNSCNWDYDARLPAGLYDVAANETWLEEKAAQGLHIQRIQGARVYFEKGEPQTLRYRFQPMGKAKEKLDEERLALYAELGWEYLGTVDGVFHLWRCGDGAAPELDTDPVVQAEGYRYLKHNMMTTAFMELGFLLGTFGICILANVGGGTPLRYILRDYLPLQAQAFFTAVVCGVSWEVMEVRTMLRLLKNLSAGIPMDRPRPYRTKGRIQRVMVAAYLLWIILQTVANFWPVGNGDILGWSDLAADGTPKAGIVYVDVTKLDPPEDEVEFERVSTKFHELASRMTEVEMRQTRQLSPGQHLVASKAETTHYVLRAPFLASILVGDIQADYRNWGPFEEVSVPGLDRFLVSTRKKSQVIIAAKGKDVLEVFYSGTADLADQGTYFAELLNSTAR